MKNRNVAIPNRTNPGSMLSQELMNPIIDDLIEKKDGLGIQNLLNQDRDRLFSYQHQILIGGLIQCEIHNILKDEVNLTKDKQVDLLFNGYQDGKHFKDREMLATALEYLEDNPELYQEDHYTLECMQLACELREFENVDKLVEYGALDSDYIEGSDLNEYFQDRFLFITSNFTDSVMVSYDTVRLWIDYIQLDIYGNVINIKAANDE